MNFLSSPERNHITAAAVAFQKLTVDEVVEATDEEVLAPALRPPAVGVVVGVPDRLPHPQPVDREHS